MKTLLIPVNFSHCAANAARYAADLALILKADLHLIHIIQAPVTSAEIVMNEDLYQEMVDSASNYLKQLQADLIKHTHGKIRIATILEAGSLGDKMKGLCQQLRPYAIVLGASGPTMEKIIAGSPLTSLLHELPYPVLVVPENAPFRRYRHILLACDLEDIGSGLSRYLPLCKDLREHFGSRFDIVTVETPHVLAKEEAVFETDAWKERLKIIYPDIHLIKKAKVEDGILEYIRDYDADLVMVFPKKHSFFDFHVSQSRKLARHSPIPVMSLAV